jgi:hypothetical protein
MMVCGQRVGGFAVFIEKYGVGAFGDDIAENQDADKERHHKIEKVEEGRALLSNVAFDGHNAAHCVLSSGPV